ncbi:MAG: carboxypeptidase regulatory-like domain-containing protein [Planctomycetota bacterium]
MTVALWQKEWREQRRKQRASESIGFLMPEDLNFPEKRNEIVVRCRRRAWPRIAPVRWLVLGFVLLGGILCWKWILQQPDRASIPRSTATETAAPRFDESVAEAPDADRAEAEESAPDRQIRFIIRSDGAPLSGAVVRIGEPRTSGTTDRRGVVELTGAGGYLQFVVRKPGFQTHFGLIESEYDVPVDLVPGVPTDGRVVDAETGFPIAGARVGVTTIGDHPKPLDIERKTDAGGRFTLAGLGDARPICVVVNAPGFGPVETIVDGPRLPVIELGRGARLEGRVTGSDGGPLGGALVFAADELWAEFITRPGGRDDSWFNYPFDNLWRAHAESDANGRYAIRGLETPETYTLVAFGPRTGEARLRDVRLREAGAVARHDLRVETGATLRVDLTSARGKFGGPVEGRLSGTKRRVAWFDRRLERVEGCDTLVIEDVPPGSYELEIEASGFVDWRAPLHLDAGQSVHMHVEMDAGQVLEGIVVDEAGTPISGIDVSFSARDRKRRTWGMATSDERGRFRIKGLRRMTGTLYARCPDRRDPGAGLHSPARMAGVQPGGSEVRVSMPPEATVAFEAPDDWELMRASLNGALLHPFSIERKDGLVRIRCVPIDAPLLLLLEPTGFAPQVHRLPPLSAGESRHLGRLAFDVGRTMKGRVIDEAGSAVPAAEVTVYGPQFSRETVADDAGRFSLPRLPDSVTRLEIHAEGYVGHGLPLTGSLALGKPRVFTLSRGGRLAGRVVDRTGRPAVVEEWCLRCFPEGSNERGAWLHLDADSRFEHRIAPGAYVIELKAGPDEEARILLRQRIEIRNGETTTVTLKKP